MDNGNKHFIEKLTPIAKCDILIQHIENGNKNRDIRSYDYMMIRGEMFDIYCSLNFSGTKPVFYEIHARVFEIHENLLFAAKNYAKAAEECLDRHEDPSRAKFLIEKAEDFMENAKKRGSYEAEDIAELDREIKLIKADIKGKLLHKRHG